jgi:hypothetical protein
MEKGYKCWVASLNPTYYELISLPKSMLTNYVGKLTPEKLHLLERALKIALQLHDE